MHDLPLPKEEESFELEEIDPNIENWDDNILLEATRLRN